MNLVDAITGEDVEMVKELIQAGADIEGRDKDGETPLIWASSYGHLEIVQELIQAGADVNAKDNDACTPLIWASSRGHLAVVQELIKSGANVNAPIGLIAIIVAHFNGQHEIVDELDKHVPIAANSDLETSTEKLLGKLS